jgi:two-component system sensor histidine kinase DesK
MIRWGRETRRSWQRRSKLNQIESSTRWVLLTIPPFYFVSAIPQFFIEVSPGKLPERLSYAVGVLALFQCVIGVLGIRRGIDHYLGEGEAPRRLLGTGLAALAVTTALIMVMIARGWAGETVGPVMALFTGLASLTGVYGLMVSPQRATRVTAWGCALIAGLFAAAGMTLTSLVGTFLVLGVAVFFGVFSPRVSAWYIAVMRELDEAKKAQSQLAVAEERLRFGRDLHDVMGRNLSVIALKSELATQLARRGAESAVEQMREVQELARQSQTEIRAVVRGYREAGLDTELAGARAVLRAAGVDCRTDSAVRLATSMTPEVQSALGWVVREGATNVLRHAEASQCAIRVTSGHVGTAVLVMENDGLRQREPARSGSGLDGLRERLTAIEGTLVAERDEEAGVFRLRAEVPLRSSARAAETLPGGGAEPEKDGELADVVSGTGESRE